MKIGRSFAMAGGAAKRSSDDSVFADTKKKKVLKEKCDSVVSNEKTSNIVSNGDLRQKKAFFAYFGKKFDEGTNGNDVGNTKNDMTNISTEDINDELQMMLVKRNKNIGEKKTTLRPISSSSVKYDTF